MEAFPSDTAPKYVLRDRDAIYCGRFRDRVSSLGIEYALTAPRSASQNPFVDAHISVWDKNKRKDGTFSRDDFR